MFPPVSKPVWSKAILVSSVLLATASAAMLAYGTDPYWAQFRRGLGLILFTHRMQWVLATVSLLLCLVVVGLISFVCTLNEFVIASALLQTNKHFTLPVGLYGFIYQNYGQHWGPFAAGSLMAMIPVTILFLFLQRWIVSGLTAGSVKG